MKRANSPRPLSRSAFSMVEVTMAIGIVAFCLFALIGLLPLGLGVLKTSKEEYAAADCLKTLTHSIRNATVAGSDYKALGHYSSVLQWSIPKDETPSKSVQIVIPMTLEGFPAASPGEQRLIARVKLTPPASPGVSGSASISIAWPNGAAWDEGSNSWVGAQGSLSTWMVILPR